MIFSNFILNGSVDLADGIIICGKMDRHSVLLKLQPNNEAKLQSSKTLTLIHIPGSNKADEDL